MVDLQHYAQTLFGLSLTPEQLTQFETYARELAAWNENINLTAIVERDAVYARHFLDSLSLVSAVDLEAGMRIADIGTGAGFPGLPLHIAIAGLHTTLLEATGKKINFLKHIADLLKLERLSFVHARAEDAGHDPKHRAQYDIVTARAVARLPALLEYLLPLAKVGGVCVAMKGGTAYEEASDADDALLALGGRMHDIIEIELPNVEDKHYLVVVEKVASTPKTYPRKPGIPTRKPIGSEEEDDDE